MIALDLRDQMAKNGLISLETSRWSQREMARTRNEALKRQLTNGLVGTSLAEHDHIVLGFDGQYTDPFGGYITYPFVTDIIDEFSSHENGPGRLRRQTPDGCDL